MGNAPELERIKAKSVLAHTPQGRKCQVLLKFT